jgi:ABC-type glycerol-3-phosphate transport system substrate-binding protein
MMRNIRKGNPMMRKEYMPTSISPIRTIKFVGMYVTICLLIAPVSGCRQATPAPEPTRVSPNGAVTIRFAGYYMDEEYYMGLIQAFNKQYPTIAVEFLPRTEDQLAALGADAADVRPVWPAIFGPAWERGDLLALNPVIQADESLLDLSDLYPGVSQVFAIDGQIWAIPMGANLR